MRKASDFLMALQLTGAYKRSSLANLQVRLPGDRHRRRPDRDRHRHRAARLLRRAGGEDARALRDGWSSAVRRRRACATAFDAEEREILDELLDHGRAIRAERARPRAARSARRSFQPLLDAWGGVSLVYRKKLTDSPAYRLNHEEVEKCLEEGVRFVEGMSPVRGDPRRARRASRR